MVLRKLTQNRDSSRPSNDTNLSVLYVEDDDDNWEVSYLALRYRLQLQRARDSQNALDLLRKYKYDIVLMDIELAGSQYNGIEIKERVKRRTSAPDAAGSYEKNRETPIVFVTAYGARYSREELLRVGASDVIEKPVDFVRLSRVITKLTLKETYETLSNISSYGSRFPKGKR